MIDGLYSSYTVPDAENRPHQLPNLPDGIELVLTAQQIVHHVITCEAAVIGMAGEDLGIALEQLVSDDESVVMCAGIISHYIETFMSDDVEPNGDEADVLMTAELVARTLLAAVGEDNHKTFGLFFQNPPGLAAVMALLARG